MPSNGAMNLTNRGGRRVPGLCSGEFERYQASTWPWIRTVTETDKVASMTTVTSLATEKARVCRTVLGERAGTSRSGDEIVSARRRSVLMPGKA